MGFKFVGISSTDVWLSFMHMTEYSLATMYISFVKFSDFTGSWN